MRQHTVTGHGWYYDRTTGLAGGQNLQIEWKCGLYEACHILLFISKHFASGLWVCKMLLNQCFLQ